MSPSTEDLDPTAVGDLPLVDVREQHEWDEVHAPQALHVPMGEVPARLADLPDGRFAVVCHAGGRSARVTAWLRQQGIDAVNVSGGMDAWEDSGLPVVREG